MRKTIIIVSLHSIYKDIAEVFIELFIKNWGDCPYEVIFSMNKDLELDFPGKIEIFSDSSSLPDNILKIVKKYDADYGICLLGDAFITKKIVTKDVIDLMKKIEKQKINYCNLFPDNKFKNDCDYDFISKKNYYEVAFIAFIASKEFIYKEFIKNISDLEFEEKYMKISSQTTNKEKYSDLIRVKRDYFKLVHGIHKGKWIRSAKRKLKKTSVYIEGNKRESLGILTSLYIWCMTNLVSRIPCRIRYYIKILFKKIGLNFSTEY